MWRTAGSFGQRLETLEEYREEYRAELQYLSLDATLPGKIKAKRRKLKEAGRLIDQLREQERDAEAYRAKLAEDVEELEHEQHTCVAVIQATVRRRAAMRRLRCAKAAATTLQSTVRGKFGRRKASRLRHRGILADVRIRIWRSGALAPYTYSPLVQPRWRAHHPSPTSPANDEPARYWSQDTAGLPMWAPDRKRVAVDTPKRAARNRNSPLSLGSRTLDGGSYGSLSSPSQDRRQVIGTDNSGRLQDHAGRPQIVVALEPWETIDLPLISTPGGAHVTRRPQSSPVSIALSSRIGAATF